MQGLYNTYALVLVSILSFAQVFSCLTDKPNGTFLIRPKGDVEEFSTVPCMHVTCKYNGCIVHCCGFLCGKALIIRIKFHDIQLAINLMPTTYLYLSVIQCIACVLAFQITIFTLHSVCSSTICHASAIYHFFLLSLRAEMEAVQYRVQRPCWGVRIYITIRI